MYFRLRVLLLSIFINCLDVLDKVISQQQLNAYLNHFYFIVEEVKKY